MCLKEGDLLGNFFVYVVTSTIELAMFVTDVLATFQNQLVSFVA